MIIQVKSKLKKGKKKRFFIFFILVLRSNEVILSSLWLSSDLIWQPFAIRM